MSAYTKWERKVLVAGFIATAGLGTVSAMVAMWGSTLGYPVIARAGIAGLVIAACIGGVVSISLSVAGTRASRRIRRSR